jgi:hypothetical protein
MRHTIAYDCQMSHGVDLGCQVVEGICDHQMPREVEHAFKSGLFEEMARDSIVNILYGEIRWCEGSSFLACLVLRSILKDLVPNHNESVKTLE